MLADSALYAVVCLSVTHWYCLKMAKLRAAQTTPHDSLGRLKSKDLDKIRIGAPNAHGLG